jgi:hypothetical protein
MNATTKPRRPPGRTFYTTVLALSILATLSSLNHRRGDVEPLRQLAGRSLVSRDEEVQKGPIVL